MKPVLPLLLLLALWNAAVGESPDKNTYSNPTLGITVTKLEDWQFLTGGQMSENLRLVKKNNEEFQALGQSPIVGMMKHPQSFPDVNPSFTINVKPLGNLSGDDPKALFESGVPSFRKTFRDFEMIENPKEITLAGHKAAYMKFNYSIVAPDGKQCAICSESWIVPRGKIYFLIGSGTRQDEKTGKRAEIQKILSSLKID